VPRFSSLPTRSPGPAVRRKRWLAWAIYFALLILLGAGLYWLRSTLLTFVIALVLGYVFAPIVTRFHGWGLPRWLGVLVLYAVIGGLLTLFLRFLVPIITHESRELFERFQAAVKEAPQVYEKIEGGVGKMLDRISGKVQAPRFDEAETPSAGAEDWGFGPPVHKVPVLPPPAISSLEHLSFASSDKPLLEAGISEPPRVASLQWEGEGESLRDAARADGSALLVRQVKPGVFGVELGSAGIEVRKVAEGSYVLSAREPRETPSGWDDLKGRVVSSMRSGLEHASASLLGTLFTFFQGLVAGLLDALVGLIVVILVGAFLMIDAPRIMRALRGCVPADRQSDADDLLRRLDAGLSGVVRGQLLICLVNGILSMIGFFIFIPEYAVVLGILAGMLSLVPIFGTIISSVPAILVALTISFGHALGVLAWILGIHFLEAYVLNPSIIGRQARIHPIIVVFVLVAGEHLYGFAGILFAVPAASVVQSFVQFAFSKVRRYVL
jgi:predicted PurR-regulated permease PerM